MGSLDRPGLQGGGDCRGSNETQGIHDRNSGGCKGSVENGWGSSRTQGMPDRNGRGCQARGDGEGCWAWAGSRMGLAELRVLKGFFVEQVQVDNGHPNRTLECNGRNMRPHGSSLRHGRHKHSHVQNYDDGDGANKGHRDINGSFYEVDYNHTLSVAGIILIWMFQEI
ncbi:hypothetical protein EYF80_040856 [Liparis tanakae]|uniref:Uncharacterized protein n=1 Tax=Liparis tanakae TaxID=230148 RepID=A0A4Z2G5W3_9TELE|nr:hypothetical protein EYF80_040856 [Liparis tanakae]